MEVKLTDFGSATSLAHELQSAGPLRSIEGTLAYMSPEQTGRMNRVLDGRSDLYSLGVTLYELSTGVLPFRTADSLELLYSHIVRVPPPPHEVSPEVPPALSAVIMRLLAKIPEDRYQNALGLKADLEACLDQLEKTGSIAPFPLGAHDFVTELRIAQRVYGREQELSTLLAAWNRASRGPIELLLVSGYSGIGKSVLVSELHKSIVQSKGNLIAGKFDQLNRSVPYAAVASAFRELIRAILAESETRFAQWRSALQTALGANGAVMIEVIPELALLLGPQPSVPPLPPVEALNRFNLVFHKFCRALATADSPLVLFLDDLQWADPASLKFIQALVTQADLSHLLVIGAYRDNEVDASHLFSLTIAELRRAGAAVHEVTLKPLGLPVVAQIVADTLSSTRERTAELAELIFAKTQGNPFFMHQLMKTLHAEKLLWFDISARAWNWELARIGELQAMENVVHFMMSKLRRLPDDAQRVLMHAAAIGHRFELATLSLINGTTPRQTLGQLGAVLSEGFIRAVDADSRFLSLLGEEDEIGDELASKSTFQFMHDRVQQAAYALIPVAQRQELHLRIGRRLLASSSQEQLEQRLFAILGHMNQGTDLIEDPDERRRLAELGLRAARKAKAGLAYDSARSYCRFGDALLASDSWDTGYELCFPLRLELAECELLTGHHAESEQLLDISLSRAKTTLDKVEVHRLRMRLFKTIGRFNECLSAALSGLALLGIEIPDDTAQRKALLDAEVAQIPVNLNGRRPAELIAIPAAVDKERQAIHTLLVDLATPAFGIDFNLGMLAVVKQLNSSIRYGNTDTSAYGYMLYARTRMGGMGGHKEAYEFAKLAIALNEKFNNVPLAASLIVAFATMLHHFEPLREALKWLSRARQVGLESGDFFNTAFACQGTSIIRLNLGDELDALREENEQFLGLMQGGNKASPIILILTCARQIIKNLKGETAHRLSLSDAGFDEISYAALVDGHEFSHAAAWYHGFKLELCYLYGDHHAALAQLDATRKRATPAWATGYFATEVEFFAGLTMAAVYGSAAAAQKEQYLEAIKGVLGKLAKWATLCPSNYDHKYLLLQAELARICGEELRAMALYDEAIEAARRNEVVRDEAMANELAARCYLAMGRIKNARSYLLDAYHGYLRWGATAKAEDLAAKLPGIVVQPLQLAAPSPRDRPPPTADSISTSTVLSASILDVEAVIRSAQTLAGEVILGNVVTHLLDIAMKSAGAQKGLLILEQEGQLIVEAAVTGDPPKSQAGLELPLEKCTDLPVSVVQYVARTKSAVILGDVTSELRFAADPYLAAHQPRSLLCLPMALQGRTTGVFYLENTVVQDAFTSARVELLKLLSVQAATAIENSRLYARLQSRTSALNSAEVRLRREFEERERSEQARARLQEEIIRIQADRLAELSTPLIPITDTIMIMPLIGIMDAERAHQVLVTCLQGIQEKRARLVIIDITGLKLADNSVATTLINTAKALRLLGAQAVITGMRAEMARRFVELQIDFGVVTKSTLQSGIAYALQRTGSGSLLRYE